MPQAVWSGYSIVSTDPWLGWGLGSPITTCLKFAGGKADAYSTPIDLLELNGKRYLVAPRGRTQWVRNAEAAGEVTLKKGRTRQRFRLRALADSKKPEVLKAYLDTFRREVQQYFPVKAGAPAEAFRAVAEQYPVFELIPL